MPPYKPSLGENVHRRTVLSKVPLPRSKFVVVVTVAVAVVAVVVVIVELFGSDAFYSISIVPLS